MSNKKYAQLNPIDKALRIALPSGMIDGVQLTIQKICGFELFNTRPYHNYETWSDGWRVSDGNITVEEEDLDDAVSRFIAKLTASKQSCQVKKDHTDGQ